MGFILILIFFIVLFNGFRRAMELEQERQKKQLDKAKDYIVEDVAKWCPPHKWRYVEVRDTEGNTVKWKLVCDLCGPLKPIN